MRTAHDDICDIAADFGVDFARNENVRPNFLAALNRYMRAKNETEDTHREICRNEKIGEVFEYAVHECWLAILDEPALWY